MTSFEYVSVLLSIVVSLALAHLLIGVAKVIKVGASRFSVPLLGWVGYLAFGCVDYWFSVWHAHSEAVWSLGFVSFLLLLGATLFVTCWLVVPDFEGSEPIDLATFHSENRRKFLAGMLLYNVLGMIANQMLPGFQSWEMTLLSVGQLFSLGAAWVWDSRRVQLAAVALMYLLTAWYAVNFIPAL
jgi:hypothetical protein